MTDARPSSIERITTDYPALVYFMQCYWNQNFDDFYRHLSEAVQEYARNHTEEWVRDLLDQVSRAGQDDELRNLLQSPPAERMDLSRIWGGMALRDEDFCMIETGLRECLESGTCLPEREIQRRRLLFPEHLAEFREIIQDIKAKDGN